MSASIAAGGCLCGAVRFEADLPSLWVAHCHCSMCRRANSAAFVTWVGVRADAVRWHDPEQQRRLYKSSAAAERSFCGRCGSPLSFESTRWPGEVHLLRAAFATPIDREPQGHAFYDSHVDWFTVNDDLPKKP